MGHLLLVELGELSFFFCFLFADVNILSAAEFVQQLPNCAGLYGSQPGL
jgi:hypothetical protein